MTKRNLAASVRARLLNYARETNQDFNHVLTRFCLERLLYRMSISKYSNQFILKGAMLFDVWFDVPHRPTRDADFLGFGPSNLSDIKLTFCEICQMKVDDGVIFNPNTVHVTEIRKDASYAGIRVKVMATLDNARNTVQADIGFGDAVTPGPQELVYPTLLKDLQPPRVLGYPRYTVVSEKFEALCDLGMTNSRLKDYYDLWLLSSFSTFEGKTLFNAIKATFERRQTMIPSDLPLGLTELFTQDSQKQTQWKAFLRKNALEAKPLEDVVRSIVTFLYPVFKAANSEKSFQCYWNHGGPWKEP